MRAGVYRAALLLAGSLAIYVQAHAVEFPKPSIRWNTNSTPFTVEVHGISQNALQDLQSKNWPFEEWSKVFSVYAGQGNLIADMSVPAMLGNYSIHATLIRFQPKFVLQRGVKYRAVFRPSRLSGDQQLSAEIVAAFTLPTTRRQATTTVTHIYPSSDLLPENLLKFYIHFSAPMQGGQIYDHIHLLDETGKPVELPFLEIDEELWNAEMTRLTLFIDPGRVKRGVTPLEEIGPALEEGKSYTLGIDAAWLDNGGMPLRQGFQKVFRVGPPDREPPSLTTWRISSPKAGTREALTLSFPESMDHALAVRVIRVASPEGTWVEGTSRLSDQERRWTFVPKQTWPVGRHQVQTQNTIEDLAGNNIGKVFEIDLFGTVQRRFTNAVVSMSFDVR